MRLPFVLALRLEVVLIAESLREEAEKFPSASQGAATRCRSRLLRACMFPALCSHDVAAMVEPLQRQLCNELRAQRVPGAVRQAEADKPTKSQADTRTCNLARL